jgi:hypothetical protein
VTVWGAYMNGVSSNGSYRGGADGPLGASTGPHEARAGRKARKSALRVWRFVNSVTTEEFLWQESHYDHDSRYGRELLFLIANNEWIRATSEIIDVNRPDAINTTIKIDIDLDQVTHEAFSQRRGRLWLPIIVLPPEVSDGEPQSLVQHRPEPDPFATVTDASGTLLAMLPNADVRHRISAAIAEIIVNMAVARWIGPEERRPMASRDQRLVLSAAIYRLLRSGAAGPPRTSSVSDTAGPASGLKTGWKLSRLDNAKEELGRLFRTYMGLPEEEPEGTSQATADSDTGSDGSAQVQRPGLKWPSDRSTLELTRRAIAVMEAFAQSVIVVVPVDRESTPTVLTVHVPTREMGNRRGWEFAHPSTWTLRPLGHMHIGVLLPSADADRQVEVNLPVGVILKQESKERSSLKIQAEPPQPLKHLAILIDQILDPCNREQHISVWQCLADLARAKTVSVREALHNYAVDASGAQLGDSGSAQDATIQARVELTRLQAELDKLSAGELVDPARLDSLQRSWKAFRLLTEELFRCTSASRSSPRTVVARAGIIEDVTQRASLTAADLEIHVEVADAPYFSIARFSGWMSALLMFVVLVSFPVAQRLGYTNQPHPEVLAIVLVLVSAVQAGRIERLDRSTLYGLLSAVGNWLIAASIMPALILAVILAFSPSHAVYWALGCIGLQLIFQFAMWRSVSGSSGHARPREFWTRELDYHHSDVLRADWWRSTTADALLIGRKAYAYVVWQQGTLLHLLERARLANSSPASNFGTGPPKQSEGQHSSSEGPELGDGESSQPLANVLALLRSGSAEQNATFVVFREEPVARWVDPAHCSALDLDPDRLAPFEQAVCTVDVFIGVPLRRGLLTLTSHPLAAVLGAADRQHLIVLEIQLPIAPPLAVRTKCQWTRVRVGLRDADIGRLSAFLNDIHAVTVVGRNRRSQPSVVGVQAGPSFEPRIIAGSTMPTVGSRLVLANEMDVVNLTGNRNGDDYHWRLLGICSDARIGIESDVIQRLGEVRPRLQLAGLTYGLLHGTAVFLMLGHEPDGYTAPDLELEADLGRDQALAKVRVLMNEWRSRAQLGHVKPQPLLRVYFRAQDRPGALLDVLRSLGKTLQEGLPTLPRTKWSVWHARIRVSSHAAESRLTIRLDADARSVDKWTPATRNDIERNIRTLAARDAAAAQVANSPSGYESDVPEDPVISVSLIKAPSPPTRPELTLPRSLGLIKPGAQAPEKLGKS